MKKFTKELGPGWITLVENDDYALSRLIFGDGLEVDCDEEETPLLKKGFQQIQEYWDRAPGHLYAAAGARRERL